MKKVFRVNLSHSIHNALKTRRFTAPVNGHNGYLKMQFIEKGDWILLGDGLQVIVAIGIATCDSYLGDLKVLEDITRVDEEVRTVAFDIIKEIPSHMHVVSLLTPHIEKNPFMSMNFCVELHPKATFNQVFNTILNHSEK
jgi:hypothetical protein